MPNKNKMANGAKRGEKRADEGHGARSDSAEEGRGAAHTADNSGDFFMINWLQYPTIRVHD